MASYYYLMSSLPMLKADGEMPFPYDTFLQMCRTNVSAERYQQLAQLSLASEEGPLVSEWAQFYKALQQEMAYQRNQRLGRPAQLPAQRDDTAQRAVNAAMSEKNPLEAEKMLLEMEFEKLDALVNLHYFDEAALVGYALKLKLLERKTVFHHDGGKAELQRILNGLEQQIMNI